MFFSVTCSVTTLNVIFSNSSCLRCCLFFHGEILNRHPLPNTQNFQNPICGWTNLCQIKKKKWMNFVVQVLYYNNDWLFWLIPNRNFHGRCKVGPWKQMILKSKTWYLWLLVVPNCENQPLTLGQTNLCMVPRLYIRSNQPFTSNLRSSSFQSTTMAHGIRSSAL
jgi:hypothetical protein